MSRCVRKQKGTVCGKQPLNVVLSADKPLCAGCDKPGKDKKLRKRGTPDGGVCDTPGCPGARIAGSDCCAKCLKMLAKCRANTDKLIGLKLHPCAKCGGLRATKHGGLCAACAKPDHMAGGCVRCGAWKGIKLPTSPLSKDGVCAACRLTEKLAKAKDCTCIMVGCDNKTKGNEPVCSKCLRKNKPSTDPKKCGHPRKFSVPVFAQRRFAPRILEDGHMLRSSGVSDVMQAWQCPDCLAQWWQSLTVVLDATGKLWPEGATRHIEMEIQSFLSYGKEGGIRHETYEKLKKVWVEGEKATKKG